MEARTKTVLARRRTSIDQSLNLKRNSLNFLRLVLVSSVIFTHASQLSNPASEGILHKTTLGTPALYGFFGISGFLIAGSAQQNGLIAYFWKRFLRIFPAFWVCLILTAFVFGLIGWFHSGGHFGCGVSCYFTESDGPLGYIFKNSQLWIRQPGIAGTLTGNALPQLWNGSLWSLYFEFLCYTLLAVASVAGLLRRRAVIAVLTVALWVALLVVTANPKLNGQFNAFHYWVWMRMLELFPVFLAGSCVYLYRDKIPDSGRLALLSVGVFVAISAMPIGHNVPAYTLTSVDPASIFVVYPLIYLGIHLPFQKIGAKNDYSYGLYIYGFPIQQLLVLFGVAAWGYIALCFMSLACTIPLAVLSWWLLEKHALRLKNSYWWTKLWPRVGKPSASCESSETPAPVPEAP
jgi:peptidoglycan/LPS O-acetylase OafA/YrhL